MIISLISSSFDQICAMNRIQLAFCIFMAYRILVISLRFSHDGSSLTHRSSAFNQASKAIGRHPHPCCMSQRDFSAFKKEQVEPKKDGYKSANELGFKMPCIILVNPFLDQNVGSVARAMLNFGLSELRVVDPVCDIRSDAARALAAGAAEVLEKAKVYPTVKECISDLNRVIATTIRPRYMSQTIFSPSAGAAYALEQNGLSVGIMFGRERSGLTNDEIALADSILTIPTFPGFSSLNLAQAVNIVSYEVWNHYLSVKGARPPDEWLQAKMTGSAIAKRQDIDNFLNRLESSLMAKGYQTDDRRRELMFMSIRSIFQRVSKLCSFSIAVPWYFILFAHK
jgi:tRNA/rRNA methyltransferase